MPNKIKFMLKFDIIFLGYFIRNALKILILINTPKQLKNKC